MKTILTLSLLVLFASCGNDGYSTDKYPIPTSFQTGTWMNQDNANVTTELVFNADNTLTMTTTASPSAPVVKTLYLRPYNYNAFLASDTDGLRVWRFRDLTTNEATFCIDAERVGDIATCKHYTR